MMKYAKNIPLMLSGLLVLAGTGFAAQNAFVHLGKQADGSFIVSSGQRIEPGAVAFDGRPVDIALHPSGKFAAVLGQNRVFLVANDRVIPDSNVSLGTGAAYHGLIWSPDGTKCYASGSNGVVFELNLDGERLTMGRSLKPASEKEEKNPRPGGMAVTRDGKTLFVACCDLNAIVEIDLTSGKFVREYPVGNLPFDVKLTENEQTLIVSNWGGRLVKDDDQKAESADALIVVDPRGAPASGTVSLVDRVMNASAIRFNITITDRAVGNKNNSTSIYYINGVRVESGKPLVPKNEATSNIHHIPIGLHPTAIAVRDNLAYIACAASDNISVVDVLAKKVVRTIPLTFANRNLFGSMPNALTFSPDGKTLYVCNGGDNAIAEVNLTTNQVIGYRPAGYFPTGIALAADGKSAWVVNTKGNGSVRETVKGNKGNAHDFQGTVSVLDLTSDIKTTTAKVAANNGWNRTPKDLKSNLKVYNGAIKHVLYIIKENRTYDEIFGDLPQGNGDPKLAYLAPIMPNHRKIAQEFTLFDNGYVSGTNSADGHAWSNQALANDYLEHFYTGYRTYPDDGDCAMSIPSSGNLWDAAAKKGKSIRVYGEFCDDRLAKFSPEPKDWLEVWKDRNIGKIKFQVGTRVASLKKYIHPEVVYWPLLQSDQVRADLFIKEFNANSKKNTVPNLMVLSLPSDHSEGRDPKYPKPQSMMADNDLALGRVVEAVSKSPQWKDTCIFVIEDDAQSGPDHVDGHRTVYMVISPYVKRKFVDSNLYTTVSMIRSMELMLGIDPMNRFDALTPPITGCFNDTADLTPYIATAPTIALDDMNPPVSAQTGKELYWTKQSLSLDWSGLDRPDSSVLTRVIWHSIKGVDVPYPESRAGILSAEDDHKDYRRGSKTTR